MTIGRTNRFLLFAARTFAPVAAVLTVSAAVPAVSNAAAAATDPRDCSYNSHGTRDHAYICAQLAAKTTVKAYLTRTRQNPGYVTCKPAVGGMLRWDCSNIIGGETHVYRVVFRATSAGWKTSVTKV